MSSADERSPKRQRRSFSPASPPAIPETKHEQASIQTPPPSVHGMSPAQPLLPGLGMQGVPTPPSTGGLQSQSPIAVADPEQSKKRKRDQERDDEMEMDTPQAKREAKEEEDVEMAEDTEHRRSDHERNESEDVVPSLPSVAKVGLYKLSTESIAAVQPAPGANLLSLYNLERVQSSVARRDPVTGEKINKLRQSYTGKLKDLGLEGRNKASKNLAELQGLMHPDWDAPMENGGILWDQAMGAATTDLMSGGKGVLDLLEGALSGMRPGHLPRQEHDHWKGLLGLDETATNQPAANKPLLGMAPTIPKTAATNLLSKTAPMRNSAPSSPRNAIPARPERAGKKRRYDESSYEGYDEDGYSTGGDTGRGGSGGKRQKRKDFPSQANSPPFSTSNPGGSTMVGVRSS